MQINVKVTTCFPVPILCRCQGHSRVCNYTLRQPYPNQDDGVTSSVSVARGWLWMKAFQRVFVSNTVASIHTWEKSDRCLLLFQKKNAEWKNRNEAYISSGHICGWSFLYPALRTPQRSWLVMLGYGVSPRYKDRGDQRNRSVYGAAWACRLGRW